jgi:hypothetical protein
MRLDELYVYSRAVTTPEVAWHYNDGVGRTFAAVAATTFDPLLITPEDQFLLPRTIPIPVSNPGDRNCAAVSPGVGQIWPQPIPSLR